MSSENKILSIINSFKPITLSEMDNVKLMKRKDTKFVFCNTKLPDILSCAKSNYRILEINNQRAQKYLTKYFDTDDYLMFNLHHRGKLNRYKLRLRKYLVSGVSYVEVKYKNNKGVTNKKREKTKEGLKICNGLKPFLEKTIPYNIDDLKAKLQVNFTRLTFVHNILPERITLDYNLVFKNLENGEEIALPKVSIAEVKRDMFSQNSEITDILKAHKIYPMGFSKYCIGTAILNRHLKQNMFKPKLLFINSIDNKLKTA